MSFRRAALAGWIVFLLALVGVYFEVRGVELRYRLAERRGQLHAAALEQRSLLLTVQASREPGGLKRRARDLGVDVKSPDSPTAAVPGRPAGAREPRR